MSEPIFREKSLQKVKSPDSLNEYIRVANPGVWTILVAIIFLLIGFCVWTVFGTIRTTVDADAHAKAGTITCYLSQQDAQKVKVGMKTQIGQYNGTVKEITIEAGEGSYCLLDSDETIPDGIYKSVISIEEIHPVVFLTR